MQGAGIVRHAAKSSDNQQRGKAADGQRQRPKHAKLRAIVALIAVKGVADEAAKAGLAAEQPDLALELNSRRRHQRNAEADAGIADRQPGREIIAAIEHKVMTGKQLGGIANVNPALASDGFDMRIDGSREVSGEPCLLPADLVVTENRLALEV